jgi:hypothetical protein
MAANMKMAVFWVVAPCSVVEVYRRFRDSCCKAIALMMEAVSTSETSVNFYHTTRRNSPEDGHLQDLLQWSTHVLSEFLAILHATLTLAHLSQLQCCCCKDSHIKEPILQSQKLFLSCVSLDIHHRKQF